MYQYTVKLSRPSIDVEFFSVMGEDQDSVTFRQHWVSTYKETGKLLLLDQQLSPDRLSRTTTFFWDSEESYTQAMADPIVQGNWARKAAYNAANGITVVEESGTTI